jgi:NAD(P)-dependent dehydrogenase (short-subunit alcohol dehydrogenase family)
MTDFTNKTVLVTGAAGALGKAVATFFQNKNANIAYLDYSEELLKKSFPEQDNPKSLFVAADLTNRESCGKAIAEVKEKFGSVNILANIAGGFLMGDTVHETSDDTWDFLFNLNTRSILNTSAAVVPQMIEQGGGKIINIAAGAAHSGRAKMGAYVASKSAVLRLTESMALELREQNINVNSILPGTIDTQRNRDDMPNADYTKWVAPEKIVEVIGFLASDSAEAIHGAGIPVVGLS